MQAPRFSTPYYLAGRSAERWHRGQAGQSFKQALVMSGAGALAVKNPKAASGYLAQRGVYASPEQVKGGGIGLLAAGAGMAGHSGYHLTRSVTYEKRLRQNGRGLGQQAKATKED